MLSSILFKLSDTIQVLYYQNEIVGPVEGNDNLSSLHDVVFSYQEYKVLKQWHFIPMTQLEKIATVNLGVMNVCELTYDIKFNEN